MADALPQRIIDRITNFGDEEKCWPWTGMQTKSGPQMKLQRDRQMRPYKEPIQAKPYAIVKHGGKRVLVHKLVFEVLANHTLKMSDYQLRNQCNNTLCCNPRHWHAIDRSPPPPPPEMFRQEDPVPLCCDLLEGYFCTHTPMTIQEILEYPSLVDFDEAVVRESLIKIGKGWLCTPDS